MPRDDFQPKRTGEERSKRDVGAASFYSPPWKEETRMAKGIEKDKKENKPKLSTKEKQKKKKEKKAAK